MKREMKEHVGMGQKANPFLQIPLKAEYHTGNFRIDSGYGVVSWEAVFGTQMEHLDRVNAQLPYDIWEQAKLWAGINNRVQWL